MAHLDSLLFLWINATPDTPAWLLALARRVSTDLPALALLALVPLAIACSRVCLGLHFVSDVAFGLFVGAASALTARTAMQAWRRRMAALRVRPWAGAGNR